MIFIDSNVPMYVVSAPHANRDRAISILNTLARDEEHLITGVEVYQEILHRYAAIRRFDARDALHVEVMRSAGAGRILSFNSGFDAYPGIERLA